MLSQLFVMSPRGDTIVRREYNQDVPASSVEAFFRTVKESSLSGKDAAPTLLVDGVSFVHVKRAGLFFVGTTTGNASPSALLELLTRIAVLIKDYCGVLSEEAVRANFALVYELLDEAVDYGYPQNTSTEAIRGFILNEQVPVASSARPVMGSRGPTSVTKSVLSTSRTAGGSDEIFVDILEKISCTFDAQGGMVQGEIDGTIQAKSYLSGNPTIRLALPSELSIGAGPVFGSAGDHGVYLDDCNFHEQVSLDHFEVDRTLTMRVPDGEFAIMNFRCTKPFRPPFQVVASVDVSAPGKLEVFVRIGPTFPRDVTANGVTVRIPLPEEASRVHLQQMGGSSSSSESGMARAAGALGSMLGNMRLPGALLSSGAGSMLSGNKEVGGTAEWMEREQCIVWRIPSIPGGTERQLRAAVTIKQEAASRTSALRRRVGPVSMQFVVPRYNASGLQIRYLQVLGGLPGYNPQRWVRYALQATSYVQRV